MGAACSGHIERVCLCVSLLWRCCHMRLRGGVGYGQRRLEVCETLWVCKGRQEPASMLWQERMHIAHVG